MMLTNSAAPVELLCAAAAVLLCIGVALNAMVCAAATAIGATQAFKSHRAQDAAKERQLPPILVEDFGDAFVSVHLAVHNEPPEIVCATLDALAQLDYPHFEVIVVDNNTVDPETWRPVQAYVAELGTQFRFLHREHVVGAKAGALNIALAETDARAEFIAIIDADYHVTPDFLTIATQNCNEGVHFVQFPQAYRNAGGAELPAQELADYFRTFPVAANRAESSLLTGTLSLISVGALRSVGGWPTDSITEDAALGVKLWRAGARGRYVDQVVGHGLLPLDLAGLRTQRRRWAAGNMQVLLKIMRPGGGFAERGRSAVFGQLTAWTGFMALPLLALALAALAPAAAYAPTGPAWAFIKAAAEFTIAMTIAGMVLRSVASAKPGTMLVSLALIWTSSLGWLPALIGRPLRFHRTPKARARASWRPSLDLIGSFAALGLATAFWLEASPVTAAILALSASGLLTAPFVDRALRRAARQDEGAPCPA